MFRFQWLTAGAKQPFKVLTFNSRLCCSLATCVHPHGTGLSRKEAPPWTNLMAGDVHKPQAPSRLRCFVTWTPSTKLLPTFQTRAGNEHSCGCSQNYFVPFNDVFYCLLLKDTRRRSVNKLRTCPQMRFLSVSLHILSLHSSPCANCMRGGQMCWVFLHFLPLHNRMFGHAGSDVT